MSNIGQVQNQDISQLYSFSFNQPLNDLNTFTGRFIHLQRQTDPRNFFISNQQLEESKKLVENYRQMEIAKQNPLMLNKAEFNRLVRAQSIVDSSISKDNGEQIPRFMRMCAFVPVNVPILFGMILSPPSTANTIFWQWFNQSFNAGLNYGNRNSSSKYTNKDLMFGYSAAVGSSVSTALILRRIFGRFTAKIPNSSPKLILINALVASIAGGTASFLNTFCMRQAEMNNGIEYFADEELQQKLGVSQQCARKAIIETAFSRVFLSISCLMTPAFIFYAIDRLGKSPKGKFKIPYEVGVFLFALMVNLPASIAMFPTTGSIDISILKSENEEIQNQVKGNRVYYYKGL
ncbi:sideroflexin [Stylonychia lemnae]|uniref:Sideroflexin n=1 Tax=Stylonychia lemnae TaxID=5949 RepID=A0A078APW9_STYLE|nr:sideroflexin [Stylonychia lemnae]|eukprot:CDW84214.1 sideroflexin [Stylonychia lemnae]